MDIDNKNPSWEKMINLCAVLMSENEQYKNGWAMEMATQAKQNARRWFIAWVITLGALIGTNAAWIHAASGYDYVSQDGEGQNYYNADIGGDVMNGSEGPQEKDGSKRKGTAVKKRKR